MRLVYMSDDGKIHLDAAIQGSDKAVRDYEEKQRDPLAKMHFPYLAESPYVAYQVNPTWKLRVVSFELEALVAFANLAPKIKAWRATKTDNIQWYADEARDLILAYDEALEMAKKL